MSVSAPEYREAYVQYRLALSGHQIELVFYTVGRKHICIAGNVDSGAAICRVTAASRVEALDLAMRELKAKLAEFAMVNMARTLTRQLALSQLRFVGENWSEVWTVRQFLALPLKQRQTAILSGCLEYLAEDGSRISAANAIRQMRNLCAKAPEWHQLHVSVFR